MSTLIFQHRPMCFPQPAIQQGAEYQNREATLRYVDWPTLPSMNMP
ncbi:MAG: hypothetical protein ACPGSB_02640 [Opitutales bacterium]